MMDRRLLLWKASHLSHLPPAIVVFATCQRLEHVLLLSGGISGVIVLCKQLLSKAVESQHSRFQHKQLVVIAILIFFAWTLCSGNKKGTSNMVNQEETFEISHTFKTNRKTAFEMWTDPDNFSSWLGPDGAEMTFLTANVVEGGTSLWKMTTDDGMTKFGQINFKTIDPSQRLIYTQNFCDKYGNFIKAPFSATYPDYLLTTIIFSGEGDATKINVKWEIFGKATKEEKQTFAEMKAVMKTGWTASFHKLKTLLKQN